LAQQGKPLGSMIIDIGLDGSKMTKSLDGIKRQIRAAQSEMKAHMSVISQAGNGYKTMEAKVNGLTKVMASNEKQIEVLHEKYEQAKKDFGENSKQAQKYAAQINNAVAKQAAMKQQLDNTKLAMREYKRGTQDLKTQLDQAARSTTAAVSVLKAQGKEYQAAKAEKDGLTKSYRLQTQLIEKEKEKLKDLIKTKGEDSKEVREQKIVIEEAIAKQKLMGKALQDLDAKIGNASKKSAEFADRMATLRNRLSEVSTKLKDVGREASMKISLPIVGALGAAVKTSMDFEAQMSRVGAIAGASADELKKLKESALELGASTSKSATEVAVAQENLAALGFTSKDIIAAMPGVISAAEASAADMAQTADVVASALNIWGIEAGKASRVADVLAESANRTAADITDMQYAFKYAGAPAAALGVSMEETAASIGIMTNAGLQGENAGTALRASLLALLNPSEENSKQMDALGISVTDAEGNFIGISGVIKNFQKALAGQTKTQKAATIASLVGTEATSGFLSLMEAGPEEIDKMTKALENSSGASKDAAQKMKDNLKGSLEELGGAFETAGITIGNTLAPAIRSIASAIQNLVNWFNDLSPSMQTFITYASLVAAAIGPLLLVAGALAGSIGNIVNVVGLLGLKFGDSEGKIGLFSKVLDGVKLAAGAVLSPFGLVIGAITALVAGFVLAYNKSETFRNFINGIGEAIKNMIPPEVIETVKSFINGVIEKFNEGKNLAQQAFTTVSQFIQTKINEIKAFWDENGTQILQAFSNVFNGIQTVVTTVFSAIMMIVQPIWNALTTLFQTSLPYILQLFQFIFNTVLAVIQSVWENIKGVISGSLNVIMGIIKMFSGLFTGDFSKMWEGIKQVFFGAINLIWNWMQLMFWGKLLKGLTAFGGTFKGIFTSIWGGIKTVFSTVIGWIVNFVKSSFTRSVNTVKGIFNALKTFVSWVWNGINGIFKSVISTIVNFVRNMFTNMKSTVSNIFNGIRNIAKSVWEKIKDIVIKPVMNVVSRVGSLFSSLRNKISQIFNGIRSTIFGIFNKVVDAIKNLPGRMAEGLKKNAGKIANGMKAVSKFLLEGLAKGVNGVTGGINWILDKVHAPKKLRIPKWKIPEYAKGTDNHEGGLAKVSDGKGPNKRELIRLPNGQLFLSPKKETIMNLPKGTSVLDGNSTAAFLKGKGIPAYAKGKGILQEAFGAVQSTWNGAKDAAKAGFEKVKNGAVAVWDFASNPLALIKSAISSFTNLDNVKQPALGMVKGVISKASEGAKSWIQKFLQGGDDVKASGNPTADVKKWVTRAMEIAGVSGRNWLNGLSLIAMKESGGNPRAQNNWDINAKRGIPSKGLMQTIGPTFNAYKMKGYDNIFNPVHNIIAAIRYIKSRYKTIGNVPGVKAVNQGRRYIGYENGGFSFRHKLAEISEGNKPEAIVPLSKAKRGRALQILAKASEVVGFENGSKVTVNNDTSKLEQLLQEQNKLYEQQNAMTQQMLGLLFQLANQGGNSISVEDLANKISALQGKQFNNKLYQQGGF